MRNSLLAFLIGLQCLFAGTGATPAFAKTDRCLASPRCRRHIEQARMLSSIGLASLAIDEYQAAYNIKSSPWIIYNIARLLDKLSRPAEAVYYYKKYIHEAGNESTVQYDAATLYISRYEQWRKSAPRRPFVSPADPLVPAAFPAPTDAAGTAITPPPVPGLALSSADRASPPPSPVNRPSRLGLWLGIATLSTMLLAGIVSSIAVEARAKPDRSSPTPLPDNWVIVHPFQ